MIYLIKFISVFLDIGVKDGMSRVSLIKNDFILQAFDSILQGILEHTLFK